MNEPIVIESVTNECQSLGRAHESSSARAEQLIACLEGEIAKRDARIVELESDLAGTKSRVLSLQDQWRKLDAELAALKAQYQRDVWGLNNEGDPIGGDPAGGYANDNARLRSELAAIKAQDTVGEVVGWYRLDRPYEMTSYPSVCATWHRLGAPVAPLYAAPAAPAADAWISVSERLPNIAQEVIVHSEFDGVCAGVLDSYGEWFAPCSEYKLIRVTSWMPMPTKIEANRHDQ